jgi:hypothetical protein
MVRNDSINKSKDTTKRTGLEGCVQLLLYAAGVKLALLGEPCEGQSLALRDSAAFLLAIHEATAIPEDLRKYRYGREQSAGPNGTEFASVVEGTFILFP